MTTLVGTRKPGTDEYSEYYARYVNEVPDGNILEILEQQIERTHKLLDGLSEEEALFRPTPEDWSVKEVVCHLCDAERIFAYRALRIGRADKTPLTGFDQVPYVVAAHADVRPLADLLAEFGVIRQATLWLLRGLPLEAWDFRGTASDQPFSVLALAYVAAGHENHHVKSLKAEYLNK